MKVIFAATALSATILASQAKRDLPIQVKVHTIFSPDSRAAAQQLVLDAIQSQLPEQNTTSLCSEPLEGPAVEKAFKQALRAIDVDLAQLGESHDYRLAIFGCNLKNLLDSEAGSARIAQVKQSRKGFVRISHHTLLRREEKARFPQGFRATGPNERRALQSRGTVPPQAKIPNKKPNEKYINWVEQGFSIDPLLQNPCEDCYAMASYFMLSARCFIDTKHLFSLSAQQYLTCDAPQAQQVPATVAGVCQNNPGGSAETFQQIFEYAASAGCATYKKVPYSLPHMRPGRHVQCKRHAQPVCMFEEGAGEMLFHATNNQLMQVIANYGPAVVAVFADPLQEDFPVNQIFDERNAPMNHQQDSPNHAVTVVGYDTTDESNPYWIVMNSWGSGWGQNGYFFVSMNGPTGRGVAFPGTLAINTEVYFAKPGSMSLNNATNVNKQVLKPIPVKPSPLN